jgi:transcriptional regulator with XRE-family HTH domain
VSGIQPLDGPGAREPFAARLRRLREAAGLTQRQLAGEALHPSYVSLLEAGRRTPTPAAVAALAARLGVAPAELAGDASGLEAPLALAEAALGLGRPAETVELLAPWASAWSDVEAGTDPLVLRAALMQATALERLGRVDEAVAILEPLRLLDERAPGRIDGVAVSVSLVRIYRDAGDLDRAVDLGEKALTRLGAGVSIDVLPHAELVSTLSSAYSERGDLLRSATMLDELLTRTSGEREARAKTLWNAAITATERGRTAEGLQLAEQASLLLSSAPDVRGRARLKVSLAWVLLAQAQPDAERARSLLREALPLLRQHDSSLSVAAAETELTRCELVLGRPDVAARHARSALKRLAPDHRLERARALAALGAALLQQGDTEAGTVALDESAELLVAASASRQAAVVWRQLAEARGAAGDLAGALDSAQRALDAAGIVREPVTPDPATTQRGPRARATVTARATSA